MTAPKTKPISTFESQLADETGRILAAHGWEREEVYEYVDDIVSMIRDGKLDNFSGTSKVAKLWREAGQCPEDFYSLIDEVGGWLTAWKETKVGRAIR